MAACLTAARLRQEQPFLGLPFFHVHPCHTSHLLAQVKAGSACSSLLLLWLSSVAPLVGLVIQPALAVRLATSTLA